MKILLKKILLIFQILMIILNEIFIPQKFLRAITVTFAESIVRDFHSPFNLCIIFLLKN